MHKSKLLVFIFLNFILFLSIFSVANLNTIFQPTISPRQSTDQKNNSYGNQSSIPVNDKLSMTTSQIEQIIGLQWLRQQGFNGTNVIIGIVDTGINNVTYANEFGTRVLNVKSFVSTTNGYAGNDSSVTDTYGHGTEVASVAAGSTYGMAPGAKLVGGKILTSSIAGNAGYYGEETTRGVVNAILYCVQQNATIINLSIGQYSNIVNDGRQYIIDKMSKEHNVIFTISAANEGVGGIEGGSIGTPGTAFQAITVAASIDSNSMAGFSSSGIRTDYTIKPDLTAPGVSIATIGGLDSGTSFSAPIVAGGIAVLIDALARSGRSYTVGAIKAALIETANPIGNYPVWYQGAGMVNFTAAYQLLMGQSVNNKIPVIATAFPKQLPVAPLNMIFIDQTTPFNLTVVTGQYDSATISLHGIPNDTMSFNTFQYFNASERLTLSFHPTENTLPGSYKGYLLLDFSLGPQINVSIEFTVKIPLIKVLFDQSRNGFINDKATIWAQSINSELSSSPSYLPDPWRYSTSLLGQYRDFYSILASNNISVTPFFGTYTNLSYLQNFDVIMFMYPNSKVTNPFTDWYNDPTYGGYFNLTEPTLLFTPTELSILNLYVKEYSKSILILTSDQQFTNVTAFNSFLDSFNIGYHLSNGVTIDSEPLNITSNNYIFSSVSSLDYYGTTFNSTGSNSNTISLEGNKFLLLNDLSNTLPNRGRIIVGGSAYFTENYLLDSGANSNYLNDCKFVLNLFSWLNSGNIPQTVYLTTTSTTTLTSTIYYPSSSSCNYTPPSENVTSSAISKTDKSNPKNTPFDITLGLMVVPILAFINRKMKKH